MEFRQLMDELAERLGIRGGLTPDAEGVYRMGRDGIAISMMEVPEDRSMLIYGSVCELPVEGADEFKSALLRENFLERGTPDGAFSLTDDGKVVLHRYLSLDRIDAEELQTIVEDYLRRMVEWRRLEEDYRPVAAKRAAERREKPNGWMEFV